MIKLFPHAQDSPSVGSPTYAQALLRVNYQYYLSGLVEIQMQPEGQIILLVAEGTAVTAFRYQDDRYIEFPFTQLSFFWPAGDAAIRSINLPREAVRLVKNALDWYPAAETLLLDSRDIAGKLAEYKSQMKNALLQFSWQQADGFIMLSDGHPNSAETVFSGGSGIEAGASQMSRIQNLMTGPCTITIFEARPDTQSYKQQVLRSSVNHWWKVLFNRYTQLVGRNLSSAMVTDINSLTRSRSWYIQAMTETIIDTHVFQDVEQASQAYKTIFKTLTNHTGKVIGPVLANKLLDDTFATLNPKDQQSLVTYCLAPAGAQTMK